MTADVPLKCNVRSDCRTTALYGVQGTGYGRCACEKHQGKAVRDAAKAAGGAMPRVWPLAYFEAPGGTEQLELPLEGT